MQTRCRNGTQFRTGSIIGNTFGRRTGICDRLYRPYRSEQPESRQFPHRCGKLIPPCRKTSERNTAHIGERHLRGRNNHQTPTGRLQRIPHGRIIHEACRTGRRTENAHRRTGNGYKTIKRFDAESVTRTCNARNTNVSRAEHGRATGVTRTCNANSKRESSKIRLQRFHSD